MDDFVTEFNEKEAAKSREVCERIEREDAERGSGLSEVERMILDAWPRFEDGSPVWFGDAVEAHHDGAIVVEAIEFSRGKVCVKDAEDGDWDTSMYAMHPLKRPAPKVLDADGVEIKVGDTVWCDEDNDQCEVIEVGGGTVRVRYQNGYTLEHYPSQLTHTRPDSWEQLEEDAGEDPFRYCKTVGKRLDTFDNAEVFKSADIVRRAKALAGVEVGE